MVVPIVALASATVRCQTVHSVARNTLYVSHCESSAILLSEPSPPPPLTPGFYSFLSLQVSVLAHSATII